jgi:hypothetical protein
MTTVLQHGLARALAFLDQLEAAHLPYRLEHVRDSLMVIVVVPGERWEIEFFPDDHVEVERFVSTGVIENEDRLADLLTMYAD